MRDGRYTYTRTEETDRERERERGGERGHGDTCHGEARLTLLLLGKQRNLPAPAFRPATLVLGMSAIMAWGFYKLGQGIREQKYGVPSPPLPFHLPGETKEEEEQWGKEQKANSPFPFSPVSSAARRCGPAST